MADGKVLAVAFPIVTSLAMPSIAHTAEGRIQPIGVASREADGMIVSTLRAEGAGGLPGGGLIRYPSSDPEHAMVARHAGPIPPGELVPVIWFGKQWG